MGGEWIIGKPEDSAPHTDEALMQLRSGVPGFSSLRDCHEPVLPRCPFLHAHPDAPTALLNSTGLTPAAGTGSCRDVPYTLRRFEDGIVGLRGVFAEVCR